MSPLIETGHDTMIMGYHWSMWGVQGGDEINNIGVEQHFFVSVLNFLGKQIGE